MIELIGGIIAGMGLAGLCLLILLFGAGEANRWILWGIFGGMALLSFGAGILSRREGILFCPSEDFFVYRPAIGRARRIAYADLIGLLHPAEHAPTTVYIKADNRRGWYSLYYTDDFTNIMLFYTTARQYGVPRLSEPLKPSRNTTD